MIQDWAQWLAGTRIAEFMQLNEYAFPLAEVLHICTMSLLIGTIFVVDLRLANLGSQAFRISRLMKVLVPISVVGFVGAVATGLLLFSAQPVKYLNDSPFPYKMGLILIAGINMLWFHLWTQKTMAAWDDGTPTPAAARFAAYSSMIIWICVLVLGRFVGFIMEMNASPFSPS